MVAGFCRSAGERFGSQGRERLRNLDTVLTNDNAGLGWAWFDAEIVPECDKVAKKASGFGAAEESTKPWNWKTWSWMEAAMMAAKGAPKRSSLSPFFATRTFTGSPELEDPDPDEWEAEVTKLLFESSGETPAADVRIQMGGELDSFRKAAKISSRAGIGVVKFEAWLSDLVDPNPLALKKTDKDLPEALKETKETWDGVGQEIVGGLQDSWKNQDDIKLLPLKHDALIFLINNYRKLSYRAHVEKFLRFVQFVGRVARPPRDVQHLTVTAEALALDSYFAGIKKIV